MAFEIVKHKLDFNIKKQDLILCTATEFKLIQSQNYIESYVDMKMKTSQSSSSKLHYVNPRTISPPINELLNHSVIKKYKYSGRL